jgi:hypothetical protein
MITAAENIQDIPALHEKNLEEALDTGRNALQGFFAPPSSSEVEPPTLEEILVVNAEQIQIAFSQTTTSFRGLLRGTKRGLLDEAEEAEMIGSGVALIRDYGSSSVAKAAMRAALDATVLRKAQERTQETGMIGSGIALIRAYASSKLAKAAMRNVMDPIIFKEAQEAEIIGTGVASIRAYGSSKLAKMAMRSTLDGQRHELVS